MPLVYFILGVIVGAVGVDKVMEIITSTADKLAQ